MFCQFHCIYIFMSCPFHDVKGFLFKIPSHGFTAEEGGVKDNLIITNLLIHQNNYYQLCSNLSRSDEPRGEPSLLGLSRGEDASRRKPMSEDASRRKPRSEDAQKKLCTATRERLSLDCGAKL